MFKTPILFLIFNRLDTAQKVFEKIREQKPKYLYIAADWPRKNKKWEAEACKKTREEILKQIDWNCELKTLFRDENFWCKKAVSWAITRFFENVEQWIILEDDCLPDSSFFWFCETMLEKYKDDTRVMMISWDCFLPEKWQKNDEYAFTNFPHIRGWASRRRSWNLYDIDMKRFNKFKEYGVTDYIYSSFYSKSVLIKSYDEIYNWKIDTWDSQRCWMIKANHWLTIFPLVNLISNIWFSTDALHTKNDFWLWNLPTKRIEYKNLKEPEIMNVNRIFEQFDEKRGGLAFKLYVANILKKLWLYKIVAKILGYNV